MIKPFIAALAASAFLTAAAWAEDAKYVKLLHADTDKVLAVENNSEENEAKVVLARDDGSESQQWKMEKDGDHYKFTNRKSGKVLDVMNNSTDEGATIIQWDDKSEDNDNQRWSWEGDGKTRRLKSKSSKHVLAPGDDGAVVQKKLDDKAKGQLWEAVEIKKKDK